MKPSSQSRRSAQYYWQHAKHYRRDMLGVAFVIPITVLVNSYLPALILANVLSRLSQHHYQAHHLWQSFGPQLVLYAGLLLAGILTWRLVDIFTWRLEANVQQDIGQEIFSHMLEQSADFHANNFSGSLVSQANKLLGGYIRAADTTIFQVYPLIAGIIITAVILLPRTPLFVVFLILFSIGYIITAFIVSRPVQRVSAAHAAAESQQTGYLADAITNVMAIKGFSRGSYERRRFREATDHTRRSLFSFARIHRRQMNYLGVIGRSISGVSLTLAVVSVMVYGANIATVFLILSYSASLVEQLFQFSNGSLRNYNRALGDASEMVEILATQAEIRDPDQPEPARIKDGAITFDNVTFTHNGADDAIFESFDLALKAGEKVGLVGHSGSGKTTFTRLLMRFSDVDDGSIQIDGQNIARITQDDLHQAIAYVPQEPLLFHRSIAENIGYGKANADHASIERAAKYAHADEFIAGLPQGYETLVGERGVKLSGGQRQRIVIARAMLKNAPILLLDEATSALDSESEALIQDALWKLMENRTAVVIAHRLSTIQKMDRIVVLDNGRIAEQGSHRQLLRQKGVYAKLWQRQSGGFMSED